MEDSTIISCNLNLILSAKITIFTMVIPIISAIINFSSLNKALKLFFGYCMVNFSINCLELLYTYGVDNYTSFFRPWLVITDYSLNFLLILYQLTTFLFLGWFFSTLLSSFKYKTWIWRLSILLCITAVIAYIIEQGWKNYGVFGPTVEAIYSVVIPLLFLWYLSRKTLGVPLLKNPYFLISLGLAMPNLIGLFLFFIGDSLHANYFCLFARLSIAKNCIMTIGQFLFALAFWRAHFTKYIPPTAI